MNSRQRANLAAAFRAMQPNASRGATRYTYTYGPGRRRTNTYGSHQGARECARRRQQGLAPRVEKVLTS